jgi:hypothetical protein
VSLGQNNVPSALHPRVTPAPRSALMFASWVLPLSSVKWLVASGANSSALTRKVAICARVTESLAQ